MHPDHLPVQWVTSAQLSKQSSQLGTDHDAFQEAEHTTETAHAANNSAVRGSSSRLQSGHIGSCQDQLYDVSSSRPSTR
jgi:hypothetical protein